jgi:uncharacterized protein
MVTEVAQLHIGFGQVRHRRSRPVVNAFAYGSYFLFLPLRSMAAGTAAASPLAINRFAPISFYDCDHGDGQSTGALAWLDALLHAQGIHDATGEAWLHCYPRVLGYTFKPVSFWYCHRADASLRAIVVEVNNTFGERHFYLLDHPRYGHATVADKVFHVSPFCQVKGHYRFLFMRTPREAALALSQQTQANATKNMTPACAARTVVRIDYFDEEAGLGACDAFGAAADERFTAAALTRPALLTTSVSGVLRPLSKQALRHAFWAFPFMTFGVVARIHWQAWVLFCKRVRFFAKPDRAASLVKSKA